MPYEGGREAHYVPVGCVVFISPAGPVASPVVFRVHNVGVNIIP